MRTTKLQDPIESELDFAFALYDLAKKARIGGRLEGKRALLERQLRQRFGTLPPAAIARLESATLAEVNGIALRVLTAASVEDILSEPSPQNDCP